MLLELLGYVAAVVICLSLFFRNMIWLRIINIVGSSLFLIYSIIGGIYPLVVVNIFAIGSNTYRIVEFYHLYVKSRTKVCGNCGNVVLDWEHFDWEKNPVKKVHCLKDHMVIMPRERGCPDWREKE